MPAHIAHDRLSPRPSHGSVSHFNLSLCILFRRACAIRNAPNMPSQGASSGQKVALQAREQPPHLDSQCALFFSVAAQQSSRRLREASLIASAFSNSDHAMCAHETSNRSVPSPVGERADACTHARGEGERLRVGARLPLTPRASTLVGPLPLGEGNGKRHFPCALPFDPLCR